MATTQQRDYFAEILLPEIGKSAARLRDSAVTGFLSMCGHLYNKELMVVGRAVNGWGDRITPSLLVTSSLATKYAETVYKEATDDESCPMLWVSNHWGATRNSGDYNTRTSAFWRVSNKLLDKLGIVSSDDKNWPSHLVWSNLYKVAPASGGNPSKKLCDIQLDACVHLIEEELSTYRPKRLLLLTGLDWAEPFLKDIEKLTISNQNFMFVEACAQTNLSVGGTTKIVVAAHPQGKDESTWVQEVIDAFRL